MRKKAFSPTRLRKGSVWVLIYLLILVLAVFTALPLVYLIATAFKPLSELYVFPPRFFVQNPTLKNFQDLMLSLSSSTVPFTRYFFNSFLITILIVTGTVIVSTLGAYSLVKHHPPAARSCSSSCWRR